MSRDRHARLAGRPPRAGRLRRRRVGVRVVRRARGRARDRARLLPAARRRPHGQRARPTAHPARPDLRQGHVPGGFTIAQMAERLAEKQPRLSAEPRSWPRPTIPTSRSSIRPPGITSLEGLLFPDTYQVSNADNEAQVVERMIALMERVAGPGEHRGRRRHAGAHTVRGADHRLDDREGSQARRGPARRSHAVIYNRLYLNMPLQIDATLLYGQPKGSSPTRARSDTAGPTTRTCSRGSRRRRSPTRAGPRSGPRSTRRPTRRPVTRCARRCPTRLATASTCTTCSPTRRAATPSPSTLEQHQANVDAAAAAGLLG